MEDEPATTSAASTSAGAGAHPVSSSAVPEPARRSDSAPARVVRAVPGRPVAAARCARSVITMVTYSPQLTALLDREALPDGGVVTADVDYDVDGTACRGFVAAPAGQGPFPAVVVFHDWTGVGDYVQMRCEMLARLGYLAFAGDVYGADVRPSQAEAPAVAGSYYGDLPLFRTRIAGAHEAMLADPRADAGRAAAIGYCFGGSAALQLARISAGVRAVTSFHGALTPGEEGEAGRITAALLVETGAVDPLVDDAALDAYKADLRTNPDLDWRVTSHAGAMHAFTQPDADAPDLGAQFHARAEARSWESMKTFFADALA